MLIWFNRVTETFLIFRLGGYETGECEQPESVGLALRLLVVPGPVVFTLIALILLWKYPIDERRRKEIRLEVENRRSDVRVKIILYL